MRDRLIHELREELGAWRPGPVTAWLFGSVARGDGDPQSDIDVAVIRPGGPVDDEQWALQVSELADLIWRRTGNEASVIEYSEDELAHLDRAGERIVADISKDGIHLAGRLRLLDRRGGR